MKIRNLVLGMMTCAAVAACTSDDIVDNNDGGGKLKGEAYASIEIFAPTNANTRAIGDDSFEAGDPAENEVKEALFLFFDENGNNCANAKKTNLVWDEGAGSIAKISIPVLVLDPITNTIPTSVIAILNPTAEFRDKTLSEVKKLIGKEEAYKKGFMMSNSVYAANYSTVAEVLLSAKNVSTDKAVALANPVEIPVERIVAKVKVGGLNTVSNEQSILIGGKEVKVKSVIKGWKITATNPDSYLVKNINPTWNFNWVNVGSWNNPENFRSYWAISAVPTEYKYYSYTDATANALTEHEYCLENAGIEGSGDPVGTSTLLWAVAQLQDEDGKPVDFMQWQNIKYTVEGLKIKMASMLNQYLYQKPDGGYISIDNSFLDFKAGEKQYQVLATLKEGTTKFFKKNADGTINLTDRTEDLKKDIEGFAPVLYWKDGMTYYFTKINHDKGNDQGVKEYPGVIRNHVYKININSITGLGTPVPDPTEPIIPTKPETDKDSYLAAQVNVLKWKVVEQNVDLN